MPTDIAFSCSCRKLSGVIREVSPSRGNHLLCYCDDCQSFAHFLERSGEVLDAHGGTEIFQTSAARVAFEAGEGELACLNLRPNGLVRWYARCCNTPIANTMATQQVPFAGVILGAAHQEPRTGTLDDALGPVRGGCNARFAKGDRSTLDAHDRFPPSMLFRFMRIVLGARLRGDQRRSPFFDGEGKLARQPLVLSAEELQEVERRRDAA